MKVSGQLHALATFPQGKSPWYPLNRRLGGPQSQSGHGVKEKKKPVPDNTESIHHFRSLPKLLFLFA
jgi:hypothetical protein